MAVPATSVPTQSEVILDVLRAAKKYGAWMTVEELSRLTRYKATSVSAQLRNLRKFHFGAHIIVKRLRESDGKSSQTWEYALGKAGPH